MDYRTINFSRKEGKADLVLNRPPDNKFNSEMVGEIVHALQGIREDETLKVLVIRGANNTFSSGIEAEERLPDKIGLLVPHFTRMFDYINDICGVTIGVVEGKAADAGLELAMFCDVIYASSSATFCHPEIEMGVFPMISTAIMPRMIGRNRLIEWLVTGREVDAEEALQAGLVNRIFSDGLVVQDTDAIANKIADLSAPAIVWMKRAIDRTLYSNAMDALHISESAYMIDLMNNLDPHEGIRAKVENRDPVWRNK